MIIVKSNTFDFSPSTFPQKHPPFKFVSGIDVEVFSYNLANASIKPFVVFSLEILKATDAARLSHIVPRDFLSRVSHCSSC